MLDIDALKRQHDKMGIDDLKHYMYMCSVMRQEIDLLRNMLKKTLYDLIDEGHIGNHANCNLCSIQDELINYFELNKTNTGEK